MQRARKKMDRAKMDAQIRRLENQLDWADEDSVANEKWLRTVVLKYMFAPADIDADPGLLLDLKADIREECEKLGEVTTVTLFEVHNQLNNFKHFTCMSV
jgi:HIV Tat-specific factor 1